MYGFDAAFCLFPNQMPNATRPTAPIAAPIPMPACAPTDSPPDELEGDWLGIWLLDVSAELAMEVTVDGCVELEPKLDAVRVGVGVDVAVPVSTASPNLVATGDACRSSILQQSLSPPQHHRVEFAGLFVSHGVT